MNVQESGIQLPQEKDFPEKMQSQVAQCREIDT